MDLTPEQQNEAFRKGLTIYMKELMDYDIARIEAILVAMANIYGKHVEANEVEYDEDDEDDTDEFVEIEDTDEAGE